MLIEIVIRNITDDNTHFATINSDSKEESD